MSYLLFIQCSSMLKSCITLVHYDNHKTDMIESTQLTQSSVVIHVFICVCVNLVLCKFSTGVGLYVYHYRQDKERLHHHKDCSCCLFKKIFIYSERERVGGTIGGGAERERGRERIPSEAGLSCEIMM